MEQRMRLVLHDKARSGRVGVEVDAVLTFLDREGRDRLFLVARGATTGQHAVLPPVPGAHHELTVQVAITQRSALVIAVVADGTEAVLVIEQSDLMPIELHGKRDPRQHLGAGAKPVPCSHVYPRAGSVECLVCRDGATGKKEQDPLERGGSGKTGR